MPCTTVAPAFGPDRRQIAISSAWRRHGPCTQTAVRVVTMGASGTYDPATAKTLVTSPAGALYVHRGAPRRRPRRWCASAARIAEGRRQRQPQRVCRWRGGVVIAGGEAYADALAGSPLAAACATAMLSKRDASTRRCLMRAIRVLAPKAPIYVLRRAGKPSRGCTDRSPRHRAPGDPARQGETAAWPPAWPTPSARCAAREAGCGVRRQWAGLPRRPRGQPGGNGHQGVILLSEDGYLPRRPRPGWTRRRARRSTASVVAATARWRVIPASGDQRRRPV